MALTPETKATVIATHRRTEADSGSPEVQVALISERIGQLSKHFEVHKKDHHGRRGLLRLVSARRGLLDYVRRTDVARYKAILATFDLRK